LKPGFVISASTIAQLRGGPSVFGFWHSRPFETLKSVVLPAITPLTRRSPPFVRPKALSNAILNFLPSALPPAPLMATAASTAAIRTAAAAMRLTDPPVLSP
jgi:hypothetical protein